ncbi:MAG: aminotransferase class I/II-fold pyridoxal phosphate-dependent enzyme [Acidimicrobiia bacterium]
MSNDPRPANPGTSSVSLGHEVEDHLGSLKPPIYETSTFVFETAEEGKRFFEVAYGLAKAREGEEFGYIYSRLDNPNLRVAEARLAAWEGADDALIFNSGMAAINTLFLNHLRPGDLILYSTPAYGGTVKILESLFTELGVVTGTFHSDANERDLDGLIGDRSLAMVYLETPANPTNDIFDIAMAGSVAHSHGARLVVDNTFLSPVWQRPLDHDADLVVHSATKYLGGHSDITAGVVCGGAGDIDELRHLRYRLGTTAPPHTAWMLTRSLETLQIRIEKQTANAIRVAAFLNDHSKVASVNHLSLLEADDPRKGIFESQCLGPGAMISFEVAGGEEEAFRFLNAIDVVRLAVSLGGTESLASHPWTMSHATMAPEEKMLLGVTPGLIRFSVGVEDSEDLIHDLEQALGHV